MIRHALIVFIIAALLRLEGFCAEETVTGTPGAQAQAELEGKLPPKERMVETVHKTVINGQEVTYKATAGIANLKNNDKVIASLFYVAYTREGVENINRRPLIFCFNGGPGSAAVWLHMGLLGPKRVATNGVGGVYQPYNSIANAYSMLDKADLVFIDPITTGYSRPSPGQNEDGP